MIITNFQGSVGGSVFFWGMHDFTKSCTLLSRFHVKKSYQASNDLKSSDTCTHACQEHLSQMLAICIHQGTVHARTSTSGTMPVEGTGSGQVMHEWQLWTTGVRVQERLSKIRARPPVRLRLVLTLGWTDERRRRTCDAQVVGKKVLRVSRVPPVHTPFFSYTSAIAPRVRVLSAYSIARSQNGGFWSGLHTVVGACSAPRRRGR